MRFNFLFPLQLTKKIYLGLIFTTLLPMIFLAYITTVNSLEDVKREQVKILKGLTEKLNANFISSYSELLKINNLTNRNREQKIKDLNKFLQPHINEKTSAFPDIGMGYYSIELDSVVAIYPELKPFKAWALSHELPFFEVYQTGKPVFGINYQSISWKGDPVVYYVRPLYRDEKITGHVWASIKTETFYTKIITRMGIYLSIWLIGFILLIFLARFISIKVKNGLLEFSNSVVTDKNFKNNILPELNPIIDTIQEQKLELNNLNNKLIETFERITDGFLALDQDLRFTYINKAGKDLLEIEGQVIGKPFGDFLPNLAHLNDNLSKCLKTKTSIRLEFYSRFDKHYEVTIYPAEDGLSIFYQDITERKKFAKEMANLERLKLINQISSSLAHEIRNPLTSVRGLLQVLSLDEPDDTKKNYLSLMVEEVDRSTEILNEFVSISKNKATGLKDSNLNQLIKKIYPLLKSNALTTSKIIGLELGDLSKLILDEKEIRQLLLNLVKNALEASPNGGEIIIKTYLKAEEIYLEVIDSGNGIPQEVLNNLGTPFNSTKENGTGLGLPVCLGIVKRHNAIMDIDTSPNGTKITVRFKTPLPEPTQANLKKSIYEAIGEIKTNNLSKPMVQRASCEYYQLCLDGTQEIANCNEINKNSLAREAV